MKHTNKLIHATSPYLLQHAHNPVNWEQWKDKVLERAKNENKLILVSIGYAACHWCHVMENESFTSNEVADVMNKHFVCIKVDREERPDVDHHFMTSVQLMGLQGGWPLNVIALPDGRPVWGGTYFPKDTWLKNLEGIATFFRENQAKTIEYAEKLQQGIQQLLMVKKLDDVVPVHAKLVERAVANWKNYFDLENGGRIGQPKFPMPVNLGFLLYYGYINDDKNSLQFVKTSLEKMARGGIFDQVGGGFARYSVDDKWKVPHFEKMLYDNGQLLSIFSKGFQLFKSEEFKTVVFETVAFLKREMMHQTGAFFSSLDADSEGKEGRFYVWKITELKQVLGEDFELFSKYYNVNSNGFWEQGNFILLRNSKYDDFAIENNLSPEDFVKKLSHWKTILLKVRAQRTRPALDDKVLTSWNALVIQGLTDAYKAFNHENFLNLAINNANFLLENLVAKNGKVFHTWKSGKSAIDGFLEDYSLIIQAFISLFEVTGNSTWLSVARQILHYTKTHFFDADKALFYFSEKNKKSVVINHFQNEDNVIPAANSVMANNLHRMYLIDGNPEFLAMVKKMTHHVTPQFAKYPMAYANWGLLMLKLTAPYYEVVVCGKNAKNSLKRLQSDYHPNVLPVFSEGYSEVAILSNRYVENETLFYVCSEGVCQLPVKSVEDVLKLIQ